MTDREMLEMAARAAEVCLHPPSKLHTSYGNWGCDTTCTVCGNDPSAACWNPLADDGDALRLAAKLLFEIDMGRGCIGIRHATGIKVLEAFNHDPYAATRRAIVRAAAEIGRQMEVQS